MSEITEASSLGRLRPRWQRRAPNLEEKLPGGIPILQRAALSTRPTSFSWTSVAKALTPTQRMETLL